MLAISACAENVNLHPGWTTKEIYGKLEPAEAFVLVEREDQTFLPIDSQGQRRTFTAAIVKRNAEGNYHVTLPDETAAISLMFLAEGYQPQRRRFERSLGVGAYEFDVKLVPAKDWLGTFYFHLRPYLSGFIIDQRYKMPQRQQYFLGQWMNKSEDNLPD